MVETKEKIILVSVGIIICMMTYSVVNSITDNQRIDRAEYILYHQDMILNNPWLTIPNTTTIGELPGIWDRIQNDTNSARANWILEQGLEYVCDGEGEFFVQAVVGK